MPRTRSTPRMHKTSWFQNSLTCPLFLLFVPHPSLSTPPGHPLSGEENWPPPCQGGRACEGVERSFPCLPVLGIRRPVLGDLLFIFNAHRQHHRLRVIQFAALLAVILEHARFDNRVHRTGLFAEAAEDALGQVDVILRSAPCAVLTFGHFDLDRQCRTDRLAQLATDATFFVIGIAAQRVQAAKTIALRGLFFGELHGDLAREEIPPGQRHTFNQLIEQEGLEEIFDLFHFYILVRARLIAPLPPPIRGLHPHRNHHDPDDGERNKHFPAKAHELVIAITRKGRAEPQEQEQYEGDLAQQPDEAVRQERQRRQPSTQKHDRDKEGDQNHVGIFGQEK